MINGTTNKYILAILMMMGSLMGFAQSSQMHTRMHQDLLADQINIYKEVNLLDSLTLIYRLQEEENLFPALDLYESWNSEFVNPYRGQITKLPDSLRIDVSEYFPPTMGHVTSNFGWRSRRMHNGIDLKVRTGDTIYAAFTGKIRVRKFDRRGYGYYLVVRHNNGLETVYGHLSKFLVTQDEVVKAGQPIALGGNTGRSSGAHLHFETRLMGQVINPNDIIDFSNKVAHTDTYMFTAKKAKAVATGTVGAGGIAYHRVINGDSLGRISKKYGVSVKRLCELNKITATTTLRIGQRLRYS